MIVIHKNKSFVFYQGLFSKVLSVSGFYQGAFYQCLHRRAVKALIDEVDEEYAECFTYPVIRDEDALPIWLSCRPSNDWAVLGLRCNLQLSLLQAYFLRAFKHLFKPSLLWLCCMRVINWDTKHSKCCRGYEDAFIRNFWIVTLRSSCRKLTWRSTKLRFGHQKAEIRDIPHF